MSELDEFTYLKVIGKGSYGEVWLVRHHRDRKQYVLKKMNLSRASKRERTSADQEVKLLSRLKHPNIVSYRNSFETEDGNLHIAMQYCEGGDLYQRLKEQKGVLLDERQVVEWFVQIAMALQYMHERNILHRDLKTQNIFLTKSKIIKVGDLGIARVLDSACDMATTLIGTPYYMSPELFSNKPYNHKSDIWALGCCVYEMATLRHAFNARDMNSLVYKILKGKMPAMPRQYSPELSNLIKSMLLLDPEKRPSVNRILRDQFIKKNIAIFLEDTRKNSRRPTAGRNRPGSADSSVSASNVRSRPGSADSVSAPSSRSQPSPVEPVPSRRLPPADIPEERASKPPSDAGIKVPASRSDISTSLEPAPSKPRTSGDGESKQPPADSSNRVRKKSDIARYDLEPISEKSEKRSPESTANTEDMEEEDTIVPKAVEEVKPVVKPQSKKKHSYLKARAKSDSNMEPTAPNEEETEPKGKKSVFKEKVKVQPRPLPPPLVSVNGEGLPVSRKDILVQEERSSGYSSKSSSVSSSKEEYLLGDVPRSLPNLSARERRRQKQDVSNSQERPNSARPRLKRVPDRHDSQKVTKAEKSQQGPQRSGLSKKHRQPSIKDDESSSNSSQEEVNEVQKDHRKAKEMNNFISLLDTTLKMNPTEEKSDDERGSPDGSTDLLNLPENNSDVRRHSVPCISPETLGNTGRLTVRINLLRKDCVRGVGVKMLYEAYKILDRIEEDEVEPKLVELLGKENFDVYAGKIWQLKFCEESLHASLFSPQRK